MIQIYNGMNNLHENITKINKIAWEGEEEENGIRDL